MGVYNEEAGISETIESIICQTFENFEFIIVDDGSTDETSDILRKYAQRDPRISIIRQKNTGLTRALIAGCNAASGTYIARQDAGDISEPRRLKEQAARMDSRPDAVLVSCGTHYVAPDGEALHAVAFDDAQIADNLSRPRGGKHISHHGSAMFRRSAYEQVGGYRSAFLVAQDYDLWLRLAEAGACLGMTDLLYTARLAPGSISAQRRALQQETGQVIVRAAVARRAGQSDAPIVQEWVSRSNGEHRKPLSKTERKRAAARWYYFIGCQLRKSDPRAAAKYLRESLCEWPLHARSWIRFIQCKLM